MRNRNRNQKCIFSKEGKCKSIVAKDLECDGLDIPEDCPYKFGEVK